MRRTIRVSWLLLILLLAGCGSDKPRIEVSAARVKSGDIVWLMGSGFAADRAVMSHLRRPDGSEYNPLRLRTTDAGELVHKIDTVMLDLGTFELWIEDENSQTLTNHVQFTVE